MAGPAEYCLLWIQWEPTCMPRSDWASWMQAVGSILAIFFAWWFGRHEESERRRYARSAARTFAGLIARTMERVTLAVSERNWVDVPSLRGKLELAADHGAAISLQLLQPVAADAVVELRVLAVDLVERLRRYEETSIRERDFLITLNEMAASAAKHCRTLGIEK